MSPKCRSWLGRCVIKIRLDVDEKTETSGSSVSSVQSITAYYWYHDMFPRHLVKQVHVASMIVTCKTLCCDHKSDVAVDCFEVGWKRLAV